MPALRSVVVWLLLIVGPMLPTPAVAQLVYGPYGDWLAARVTGFPGSAYEIAPMPTQGDPSPGNWTDVSNDIFNAILARAGIIPCSTDPMSLAGRPGQLELVDPSLVLNAGGQRATFGYFVRAKEARFVLAPCGDGACQKNLPGDDYFVLMSYDAVPKPDTSADTAANRLCAFEIFTFGPVVRPSEGETFRPWAALIDGYAVNGDGLMLQGVPLDIAQAGNFKSDLGPRTGVYSGATLAGRGCMVCHGANRDFPQTTLPFPWLVPH